MIEMTIDPPSVAAEVFRVVTVRLRNTDERRCTNVVVGLSVPPELGLEQGRSRFTLATLASGGVYEHPLRLRPPQPGRFTIGVPNLSFRNGYGQSRRERGLCLQLVVDPATERSAGPPPVASKEPRHPPPRQCIFVSYRRSDVKMMVPGLVRDIGQQKILRRVDIFLDLQDIRAGEVWPEILDRELRTCALLLAVIGPDWLTATNGDGRRIDDPDDLVRHEIAIALERGIPVVPLLVETPMPTSAELPPEIRRLATRQGFTFDLAHYDRSVADLCEQVGVLLATTTGP